MTPPLGTRGPALAASTIPERERVRKSDTYVRHACEACVCDMRDRQRALARFERALKSASAQILLKTHKNRLSRDRHTRRLPYSCINAAY